MGYVTWGTVGLILCLLRWRKYLLLAPLIPIAVIIALPGVADRMLQGFGGTDATGEKFVDEYEVTSGRMLIWPHVIAEIMESPLVGYGREAMVRTGLRDFLWEEYQESFPHPHNAYLQWLLDNGLIGFVLVMAFYIAILARATRLFFDSYSEWYTAIGGVTLGLVLALLVASMGSETFYPREAALGLWGAIGLMLRVSVERSRTRSRIPGNTAVRYTQRTPRRARGCLDAQTITLDPHSAGSVQIGAFERRGRSSCGWA
jgi:O-antigen ligase